MKKIIIAMLLLCSTVTLFSQQNLSVPLTDSAYTILEYAEIRNYIKPLHNSRPYTLSFILDNLHKILETPDLPKEEKQFIHSTINRLTPTSTSIYPENTTATEAIGTYAKTGSYRFEETIEGLYTSAQIGTTFDVNLDSNINDPSISAHAMFGGYVLGDIGNNFSYNVNLGVGASKLDFSSYKPYTFSPFWAGYVYGLSSLDDAFEGESEEASAFYQFLPEFGLNFFDNKIGINYSRIRRDWGTGSGNLMLSETAQPFTAFEMYIHPVDFASLSFTTGSLEYSVTDSDTIKPTTYQNSFSAFMAELFLGDYAYAALLSSVVYPKRFELAYMMPGMIPFFTQNIIGDFDNILMGVSVGAKIPGSVDFYFNLFTDELNLLSDDFFHMDRNMYAYQTGLKAAIPEAAFTIFNIQYTKLEPYMYTHPGTQTPWYSSQVPTTANPDKNETIKMHTNYVNHGENLGYYLPPNSDELKITATSLPLWFLKTSLSYSLVRHGLEAFIEDGEYGDKLGNDVNSSLDYGDSQTPGDPSDNTDTKKYFLTDGTYEWIHSLSVQAEMDMSFINEIPISLKMAYTLSYTHHTQADEVNVSFKPRNDDKYKDSWDNYLSLSVKVW